jgi:serine/threonine-protein kinase
MSPPDAALAARLQAALGDRYRLERELGAGGMAIVWLAEDVKHRRRVAIKLLRPELAAALGPSRFVREIEIAAQLQHPHILPLLDSGEGDALAWYVMPYVEGESLWPGRAPCPCPRRSRSSARWPMRWPTRTGAAWCTGT